MQHINLGTFRACRKYKKKLLVWGDRGRFYGDMFTKLMLIYHFIHIFISNTYITILYRNYVIGNQVTNPSVIKL